jgi:hypothetical protein
LTDMVSDLSDANDRINTGIEALRENLLKLGATARQVQIQIGMAGGQIASAVANLSAQRKSVGAGFSAADGASSGTVDGEKPTDDAAMRAQKSWENALKPIEDSFASFAADIILRTRSIGAAFDAVMRSLTEDVLKSTFKGLFNTLLFGNQGSSGTRRSADGGLFGGLGSGIASGILGLLGKDALSGLIGTPLGASSSGLLAGLIGSGTGFGNTANDFSSAAGGAMFSGLFGAILSPFKLLGGLFGFARGGIVPSAQGGWSVPTLGPGGMLAQVHSQEMVLPADISRGLQGMIANGGGHTFNIGISAIDAPGVQRLFMANGSVLVAALNRAMRNGSMLYQSS